MPDFITTATMGDTPEIHAEQALLIYKVRQPGGMSTSSRETTLVLDHAVHQHNDQVVIGAGKVLSSTSVERMVSLLQDGTDPVDYFLPPTVLVASSRWLVWWVKGRVRPMHFSIGRRYERLLVPWPSLLFSINEGRLAVAALRGSRRPLPGTRLYHAPIMNVGPAGAVCLGSAERPDSWTVDHCAAWESVIYDTNFSHTNHDRTLQPGRRNRPVSNSGHLHFWRKLHRDQVDRFPAEALVPIHKPLKQWV